MTGVRSGALVVLLASACLVPNPAFVDALESSSGTGSSEGGETQEDSSSPAPSEDGTPGEGTSSEGASPEGTSSTGSLGSSSGEICEPDAYEPNDDEDTAFVLALVNDEALPLFLDGVLETPAAEDWYRFEGDDQSIAAPSIELAAVATDGMELGLCVFVTCKEGTIDEMHVCAGPEAEHAHSVGSYLHGCCAIGSVTFQTQCLGAPDNDMSVWIRVAPPTPMLDSCIDYVLEYTF